MEGILRELFVLDAQFLSKEKKYIWINKVQRIEAFKLFQETLEQGIFIEGFVSDEDEIIGLNIFHKQIKNIDEINDGFIFTGSKIKPVGREYSAIRYGYMINPRILNHDVVIYGAGNHGIYVMECLYENNIPVLSFIDSDNDKIGGIIEGTGGGKNTNKRN